MKNFDYEDSGLYRKMSEREPSIDAELEENLYVRNELLEDEDRV